MSDMSDMSRLNSAVSIIEKGDMDLAWNALYWVFCSTDLDEFGFYQTATRLGFSAEAYKNELLSRFDVARAFYFGKEDGDGGE